MAQSNAQRADEGGQPEPPQESFSNKPVVLANTGHGTKVKLWTNKNKEDGTEFQTVSIERSFRRKDTDPRETQRVTLSADDLLAVSRGLEKGHDAIVEKQVGKPGATRA